MAAAEHTFQQAIARHRQGDPRGAEALCAEVLHSVPRHAGAFHLCGLIALEGGETERGIGLLERSLALDPRQPAAHSNIGNALLNAQQPQAALARFDAAIGLAPEYAPAWFNRGNALRGLSRAADALASFDRVLALQPAFAPAANNRGLVLFELGRLDEALASFEHALEAEPHFEAASRNRVAALHKSADALMQSGQASAAIERYQRLLELMPDHCQALSHLLQLRMERCDWSDYAALAARTRQALEQGGVLENPLTLLLFDAPELSLHCARSLMQRNQASSDAAAMLSAVAPARHARGGSDKIRVAYVSADFGDHPVSHLLVGVIERHDRHRFEIIAVSLRRNPPSDVEQRLRAAFDRFLEVGERSDHDIAATLRAMQVDIAVDLMGFTLGLRPGIFAARGAPVQVSYLGYAGTSGVPSIDYLIADENVVPAGAEQWFSEHIVRLPHCYLPNDDRRAIGATPSRQQAGLPERGLVFCAFTNTYKINPPVFDVWMRLLRGIDGAVLWMRAAGEAARRHLQQEATRRGVDPRQLVFAPPVAHMADHLARLALADLFLDTSPCSAHSTACDALWAGVPVVSFPGAGMPSRVACSALKAVGLPELVTTDLAAYERCAFDLAEHPAYLRELRARLARQRQGSALFDTASYTRHLESAFVCMQQRSLAGQAPTAIAVAADAVDG